MKTRTNNKDQYSCARLPEIIVWVIGMLFFISLFFGLDLNAQQNDLFMPDTIVLSNNEVITCYVYKNTVKTDQVSFLYNEDGGKTIIRQVPKDDIIFIKSQEEVLLARKEYRKKVPKRVKFYAGPGFGVPRTTGLFATVIFKNDMGFSGSLKSFARKPKGAPNGLSVGSDAISAYSLCFVKEFYFNNPLFRFGLEAGPSIVEYRKARYVKNYGIRLTEYNTYYTEYPSVIGVSVRAKVTFVVSRIFGIELALVGNLNKHMSVGAVELYFLFGRINDKKKS